MPNDALHYEAWTAALKEHASSVQGDVYECRRDDGAIIEIQRAATATPCVQETADYRNRFTAVIRASCDRPVVVLVAYAGRLPMRGAGATPPSRARPGLVGLLAHFKRS